MADRRKLYDHQQRGLRWAKSLEAVGLFWEMRLGKTLVAIRWAESKSPKTVLVVTPLSAVAGWLNELRLEGYNESNWSVVRGQYDQPRVRRWTIATPDGVRRNLSLLYLDFDVIIYDESDNLRNPQTVLTKLVLKHLARIPNRMILSGTPAPENNLEYVTQLLFLNGSALGHKSYWHFRSRECECVRFEWELRRGVSHQLITELHRCCHPLTRKEAGLGSKEIVEVRTVEMPQALRKLYDKAEKTFELGDVETKHVPVVRMWLSRLAGGCHPMFNSDHKLAELLGLLQRDLKNEKVVIWCSFLSEVDAILKALPKSRSITGKVTGLKRSNCIHEFQNGKLKHLVVQNRSLRYGADLSAADTQIFFSLPWDLVSYLQSKDRIQHPSKASPLLTIHLLTENSVDQDVHAALKTKSRNSRTMLRLITENMKGRRSCKK